MKKSIKVIFMVWIVIAVAMAGCVNEPIRPKEPISDKCLLPISDDDCTLESSKLLTPTPTESVAVKGTSATATPAETISPGKPFKVTVMKKELEPMKKIPYGLTVDMYSDLIPTTVYSDNTFVIKAATYDYDKKGIIVLINNTGKIRMTGYVQTRQIDFTPAEKKIWPNGRTEGAEFGLPPVPPGQAFGLIIETGPKWGEMEKFIIEGWYQIRYD